MTRSPRMRRSPNGIAAKAASAKKTEKKGASVWRALSAPAGTMILLGEHLDGVGERMEQPHHPPAENAGAVGADPVLNDGRLLALQPGMQPRQVQDAEEHDARQSELDDQVFDHGAAVAVRGFGSANAAP